jgi:hypothetical protein
MFSRKSLIVAIGLAALVGLGGCSGKGGSLATVSGVVTHNGSPVEGARVTFFSTLEVDGAKQMAYGALTDSNGKYVIATVGKEPGIPAGMYKVTVVKYEGKGFEAQPGIDAGQLDAMASDQGTGGRGGPANLLPKEYASPTTSKLSATLEPGKNKDVNFDLKGK